MLHQTGAQCSPVECIRARVAVRRVVAPTPKPEPASRLRSALCVPTVTRGRDGRRPITR